VVAVFALSHAIYRHYRNNDYKITLWIAGWTVLLYACIIGAAIGLYNLTSSVTLLCLCCYMPAIIILSTESYRWWRANDYHLLQPIVTEDDVARHKRQQSEATTPVASRTTSMSVTHAPDGTSNGNGESKTQAVGDVPNNGIERSKSVEAKDDHVALPPIMQQMMDIVRRTNHNWARDKVVHLRSCRDFGLLFMIIIDIALVVTMGFTISYYSTPTYIGYSISAILLIFGGTAIPILKWFNLYRMTGSFIPCIIFTTATLASWLIVLWYVNLEAYVNDGTYTKTNALLALVISGDCVKYCMFLSIS
jgi:hypothetical protein